MKRFSALALTFAFLALAGYLLGFAPQVINPGGGSSLATPVSVANGGTGIASGTSGGVPYYSGATTIASSGALTANLPVIGGGAGAAPSVGTVTGNTTQYATWTGATTAARCVHTDASGNLVIAAADCGSGGIASQILGCTTQSAVVNFAGGNNFGPFEGFCAAASSGVSPFIVARAGTVANLTIFAGTAVPAASSMVFVLQINTAASSYSGFTNTALTCTIAATAQTCTDGTHSVSVAASDLLQWREDSTGTVSTTTLGIGVTFQ